VKTVWGKETRNEQGTFYRTERDAWRCEVPDDFSKPNFTEVEPPDAICDWDEATQSWVIDESEQALIDLQATDAELVKKCARLQEDSAKDRIANGTPVPSGVAELVAKREALRSKL